MPDFATSNSAFRGLDLVHVRPEIMGSGGVFLDGHIAVLGDAQIHFGVPLIG